MPRVSFETPEDVRLSFDVAGPGSRVAAALIDMTIIGTVVLAAVSAMIATDALAVSLRDVVEGELATRITGPAVAIVVALVSAINLVYFVGAEWLLDGQSPGKRLIGLRVVRDGGYALTLSASLIRNIARIVDMLPGPYLVGLIAMVMSREHKRLGDLMAGTTVIRYRRVQAPVERFEGERYASMTERQFELTRARLERLDIPRSFELLDGFFDRRETMAAGAVEALEQSLCVMLSGQMALDTPTPELRGPFLKELYLALRQALESGSTGRR